MTTQLIVNADDFGASESVNSAVRQAYRDGILTSASLMVTGDAAEDAVGAARESPGLAVGLHLALSRASSALPREAVPDLVDSDSRFPPGPVRAALRYQFNPRARGQLRAEIEAQFDAFARTGLELSHVDGHQHLHAHPAVLPIVLQLAIRFGAHGIRIPRDPFWLNLRADRSRTATKLATALGHAYLSRACRRLAPGDGPSTSSGRRLVTCDAVVGSLMSGRMSDRYVIAMLRRLNCRGIELYFHPQEADGRRPDPFGPNPGDLAALLSPNLKSFMRCNGFEPTTYAGLKRMREDRRAGS